MISRSKTALSPSKSLRILCSQPHSTSKRARRCAFQPASGEAAIGLHVADFGLDRRASSQIGRKCRGQALPGAADQNLGLVDAIAAIAAVDHHQFGKVFGQLRLISPVSHIGTPARDGIPK